MKPKKLYKTTIVIWTEYNTDCWGINALAEEAVSGNAYCDIQDCDEVTDVSQFPDTEFFDSE